MRICTRKEIISSSALWQVAFQTMAETQAQTWSYLEAWYIYIVKKSSPLDIQILVSFEEGIMKLEKITIQMMANHIIMMQLDSYMKRAGKREINPFEIALQSFSEIVEPMKSRHTYARTLEIRCKQSKQNEISDFWESISWVEQDSEVVN